MKKLFEKDPLLFAILWIVVYVLGFSLADGVSEAIGAEKSVTVIVGAVLTGILIFFLWKNRLMGHAGLVPGKKTAKEMAAYVPLIAITTVPLWAGFETPASVPVAILHVVSMCFVGLLEEVIFRGLLFQSMLKSGLKFAVIISSLTFGVGHIVNLLMGAPLLDTMLQLVYAAAVGFCYTAVFYTGGSLFPCVLSHGLVNSFSVFAAEMSDSKQIAVAAVETALGLGYGLWLFWENTKGEQRNEN